MANSNGLSNLSALLSGLGSDGVGDLEGVRRRLDYLVWLGVDAIWLSLRNSTFVGLVRMDNL